MTESEKFEALGREHDAIHKARIAVDKNFDSLSNYSVQLSEAALACRKIKRDHGESALPSTAEAVGLFKAQVKQLPPADSIIAITNALLAAQVALQQHSARLRELRELQSTSNE